MARPDIAEVRTLTDSELTEKIDGTRRELFELRFQQATRRLEHPHRFKEARIKLAHLLSVQKERQRSTAS
ncbi:MAG: 50S ribosomal protein L29 [Synechococcaceae cyanobacterium ELA739]|jgi:large subunit ribosomal protein L29